MAARNAAFIRSAGYDPRGVNADQWYSRHSLQPMKAVAANGKLVTVCRVCTHHGAQS